jgi:hypothetical protein
MQFRHVILACLAAFGLVIFQAGAARAQNGAVAGTVKDASGAVMPGVTVEAASPVLIERVRSVVTDGQGQYKIVDLRPGVYQVRFTLPGFATVVREGIELSAGFTATVNADMTVGAVAESVTVTSASPIVDIQNVQKNRVLTAQAIDTLPSGRSFQSLSLLIPGISVQPGGSSSPVQDVGGLLGDGTALVVHGSRQGDMQYLMNGLPHNNGSFTTNVRPNILEAQEINYQVGANTAENLAGGVIINLIPKEGGNAYSGLFFFNGANGAMQSNNLTDDLRARGVSVTNELQKIWDLDASVGGPIQKDRLWFFGSLRYYGSDTLLAGIYYNAIPHGLLYLPDLSRPGHDQSWTVGPSGRLTWQAMSKLKVSGYYINQPRRALAGGSATAVPGGVSVVNTPEALQYQTNPSNYYGQVNATSPLTSRLLLETGFARYGQDVFLASLHDGLTDQDWSITDPRLGFAYGAPASRNEVVAFVNYYRASLSYVTGSHSFKAGFLVTRDRTGPALQYVNNSMTLTFLNRIPSSITLFTTPYSTETQVNLLGLFVQDQWKTGRFTVNGGLRFDRANAYVPAQHVPAAPFIGSRDFPEVDNVPNWNDVSPRLGLAYDLFGDSRTALKVTLGRYVAQTVSALSNPVTSSVNSATRTWTDVSGDLLPQCDFVNPDPNGECGRLSNLNFGKPNITTQYDPNYLTGWGNRETSWETTVGVQQQLLSRVGVDVAYFHKWYTHFIATDNVLVAPGDYDPYCITAPRDPRLPGGGGQQICGLYDVRPSKFGQVQNFVTFADQYGAQSEVYDGIDVTVNARLSRLVVQGGLNAGRTRTNNCFVIDSPQQLLNCDVRPPLLTQVKLQGTYSLPADVQVSGTFQTSPGPQITASYVATNAEIAPSLGRNLAAGATGTATVPLIPPGTVFGDRLYQFDARATKGFRLRDKRLRVMFDLYNVFNASTVIQLNNGFGATWLRPTFILPGRLAKVGAQFDF